MTVWKEVRELPMREFQHALGVWSASMGTWGNVLDSDFIGVRTIYELRPGVDDWTEVEVSDVAREKLCLIATNRWQRSMRRKIALEMAEEFEAKMDKRLRVLGVTGGARALLGMIYGPGALP